jgi:hypothetical protein
VSPEVLARARQEMFIAEGSDWCWWYGDDHSSEHDAEFDELFRRHLRNVYRLLGRPIPDELFISNITTGGAPTLVSTPTSFISPRLDGEDSSYFEWLCAGALEIRALAGAMHQVERQATVSQVKFGFDADALYLRVDTVRSAFDVLADGWSVLVNFLRPTGVRVVCSMPPGRGATVTGAARDGGSWQAREASGGVRIGLGSILELRIPLAWLGESVTDVSFFVTVNDGVGVELERHPAGRPIELTVPDERFASRNWTA